VRDPDPQFLADGAGVAVWGGVVGELAGALELLDGFLTGRRPPGSTGAPQRLSGRLAAVRDVCAAAAREQQAARHRELAKVAQPQPSAAPKVLAPAQPSGSSTSATITTQQAAAQLGITGQRVRDLCATGKLEATHGPRKVWQITPESVARYQKTRRRKARRYDRHDAGADARPAS
jgi:hypothetical protein